MLCIWESIIYIYITKFKVLYDEYSKIYLIYFVIVARNLGGIFQYINSVSHWTVSDSVWDIDNHKNVDVYYHFILIL